MSVQIPVNINLGVDPNEEFEPGMFHPNELHFLLEHMEESPIVAWHGFDPTTKHKLVSEFRVRPFHERLYELDELRRHREVEWAGFEAIKHSIAAYLLWNDRSEEIARRSRGVYKHPSMFVWDDTGKAHRYGIDADSGEMVRTEILDNGERRPFKVKLTMRPEDVLQASVGDMMPWVKAKRAEIATDKLEFGGKGQMGWVRCPICQHTEEFKSASGNAKSLARTRMGRHLKRASDQVNRHRLLYSKSFK